MPTARTFRRQEYYAAIVATLAVVSAVLTPAIGAVLVPEHSHVGNYISELGQTGGPYAGWVNWAGFLPTGLLVLLFFALLRGSTPLRPTTLWLLSSLGWAYVLSAIFPCDPGCPCTGNISVSQQIHNLTAVIGYPAMIVGLMQASRTFNRDASWRPWAWPTWAYGVVNAIGFVLMLTPAFDAWCGLFQLVVEISSFGWLAAVGWAHSRLSRETASLGTQA